MLGWEFPPYFAGGVGVVCYELTKALSKRNVDITYIMPSGPRDVHADFLNLLVADNMIADNRIRLARIGSLLTPYTGVEEYRLNMARHFTQFGGSSGALYGHNLLAEIERFAQKVAFIVEGMGLDFDVIHAHDWTTFPAAIALKRLTGKPLIVHVHITEFDKTGGEHADSRVYAIEKRGMDEANLVIAVSNLIKNRCVNQYYINPDKVRVVYNAVDFKPTDFEERYAIKATDKIVLFLGRVTLQKGPDYFIEAARKVVDFDPNVKFIIAGTGDMLPRIIERAAALGIGNKVIFPGFVNRAQADQLYRMADVFVMPSVSEPFGIVPLEAMHHGTPAIISKQSGVSEVLNHVLKVDFWDVNDIANKVIAALSYSMLNKELKRHGADEARRFTWDVAAGNVEAVYREARGGN
jgi:glycogen synthase